MSIDGISAHDQISRAAMLDGKCTHCGETIPFVRMFYGSPSTYIWEDAEGVEHSILQGEGGDPLMPLLYSLGQHGALEATQEELADRENLVTYLDDIWVVSPVPDRVSHMCGSLQRNLFSHARFVSMVARRRFGTGAEADLGDVTRWRGSRRQQTREPVSGGGLGRQICRRHSRESWCWARLWETPLSSSHIWTRSLLNNAHCWNGFPWSQICNQLG